LKKYCETIQCLKATRLSDTRIEKAADPDRWTPDFWYPESILLFLR